MVTTLAARALGPENVLAVTMPYKTSSDETRRDSQAVIEQLGVRTVECPITAQIDAYFGRFPDAGQLRLANKCARERMTVLYDQSAAFEALVAGTSNKSELLLGYGTQFGDMASAINPVGDLYKTQLYQLAAYLGVPPPILAKAPTGDLWVGQTDEGELGFSYAEVDRLLVLLGRSPLAAGGVAPRRLRRGIRRSRGAVDPPQPLQAPHAGDRQAFAPHHGPRLPLRPRLGNVEERRRAEGGRKKPAGRRGDRPLRASLDNSIIT